jgi:hypothetical protein
MQEQSTSKINSKISQVVPNCWHEPNPKYAGHVRIGSENHFTTWFDARAEAELELRCLEKQLSYELIETVEEEGYYPERAILLEKLYLESGRTNGLYSGLLVEE